MADLRSMLQRDVSRPDVDLAAIERRARQLRHRRASARVGGLVAVVLVLGGVVVRASDENRHDLATTMSGPATTASGAPAPSDSLLVARRRSLEIVRASDGSTLRMLDAALAGDSVAGLAVAPDGATAYLAQPVGNGCPVLFKVDLVTGKRMSFSTGYAPAVSPDGQRIASLGTFSPTGCERSVLNVLDRETGASRAIPSAVESAIAGGADGDGAAVRPAATFDSVAWLPDSRHVVIGVHHGPATGVAVLDVDDPIRSLRWSFAPVGEGIAPPGTGDGRYRSPAALNPDRFVALRPGCPDGAPCPPPAANTAVVALDRNGEEVELVPPSNDRGAPLVGLVVDPSRTKIAVWGGGQLYEAKDQRLRPILGDVVAAAWLPAEGT